MVRNRKKDADVRQPDAPNNTSSTEPAAPTQEPSDNGEPRRPEVSWALLSDRTTRLEVSVWLNVFRTRDGEEFEQPSVTVSRSYRQDGQWFTQERPSYRSHDLPILLFLLQKAHAWALERRTLTSSLTQTQHHAEESHTA